ncbi:hypothetical protein SLS60_007156 [Paraconiothyrium brasiliense]|uniref:Uncharacterized protein n=1 Tax=Paraconiothyrium brasiliense TaxID=300254 RepID=A0ABR3R916_9PLEO
MAPKTWLITGCTSGFGADFVREALKRGDKAIATGRGDISRLSALKEAGAYVYTLDVTSPSETIDATVAKMIEEVGDIDVLVNNAGYLQMGLVGELELQAWRDIFETNFFGSLKMTQALLPHFRSRKAGDIVFIGSIYGLTGISGGVSYSATKFALEGLHDALLQEGKPFNIRSLMFEPGVCRTEVSKNATQFLGTAPKKEVEELAPMRNFLTALNAALQGNEVGDPKKVVKVMVDFVRGEGVAEGKEVPDRLPIGSDALIAVQPKQDAIRKQWEEWKDVILSTDCDNVAGREEPEYIKMIRSVS